MRVWGGGGGARPSTQREVKRKRTFDRGRHCDYPLPVAKHSHSFHKPSHYTEKDRRVMLAGVVDLSHGDAAKVLGVSRDTVRDWRKKYTDLPALPALQSDDAAPPMTAKLASVYAQMLHAGCPPLLATEYVAPQLSKEELKATTRLWMGDTLVKAAVEQLIGGAFITLPAEKRYELALQKHLSELAFFLHSNNFNDAAGKDGLEMFKQAREVLKAELKGGTDESDPMQAFARFALDMVKLQVAEKTAASSVAPALQPSSADRIHDEFNKLALPKPGDKLA